MDENTFDLPQGDDYVGQGMPVLEDAKSPTQRKVISVVLPLYPGAEAPAPTIEVTVTLGDEMTINAKVNGEMSCEEEYHAVMSLLQRMV